MPTHSAPCRRNRWHAGARCRGPTTARGVTHRRMATAPLGRMERPEGGANVIGFLTSGKTSYMTGQAISADGGLVMQ
jgi:NAD(P)-dependent dehydrogenase (short-subunit alcohol dehydrogenase family)